MTSILQLQAGERGGVDPIDAQLDGIGVVATRPGLFPALALLAGIALGPEGLAILTPATLQSINPASPLALAVLGVAAGLNLRLGGAGGRLFVAAQAQALTTAAVVGAGVWLAGATVIGAEDFPPWWAVAAVLALCAATSSSLPSAEEEPAQLSFKRIDTGDYILPIVAGGALLAAMRAVPPVPWWTLFAQTSAIALTVAVSGWLLLSTAVAPEQRIFFWGTLLLLGGAADYAASSALCAGLVAGLCWRRVSLTIRDHIHRDTAYLQHPLLVLVLLFAGANAEFTRAGGLLALIYLLLRIIGKLVGGWLAATAVRGLPDAARRSLVSPGIFGVAFALNVFWAAGESFVPVLTAVVIGTIASSLVGALVAEQAPS